MSPPELGQGNMAQLFYSALYLGTDHCFRMGLLFLVFSVKQIPGPFGTMTSLATWQIGIFDCCAVGEKEG